MAFTTYRESQGINTSIPSPDVKPPSQGGFVTWRESSGATNSEEEKRRKLKEFIAKQRKEREAKGIKLGFSKAPEVRNKDNSISTIRTISINEDGKEILIPTVRNGLNRIMTNQEAIDYYHKTGINFGKFNTIKEANKKAEELHRQEEQRLIRLGVLKPKLTFKPTKKAATEAIKSTFTEVLPDIIRGGVDVLTIVPREAASMFVLFGQGVTGLATGETPPPIVIPKTKLTPEFKLGFDEGHFNEKITKEAAGRAFEVASMKGGSKTITQFGFKSYLANLFPSAKTLFMFGLGGALKQNTTVGQAINEGFKSAALAPIGVAWGNKLTGQPFFGKRPPKGVPEDIPKAERIPKTERGTKIEVREEKVPIPEESNILRSQPTLYENLRSKEIKDLADLHIGDQVFVPSDVTMGRLKVADIRYGKEAGKIKVIKPERELNVKITKKKFGKIRDVELDTIKKSEVDADSIQFSEVKRVPIKDVTVKQFDEKIVAEKVADVLSGKEIEPIVVDGKRVVDGNHTVIALKQLGIEEIPVVFLDSMADVPAQRDSTRYKKFSNVKTDIPTTKLVKEVVLVDPVGNSFTVGLESLKDFKIIQKDSIIKINVRGVPSESKPVMTAKGLFELADDLIVSEDVSVTGKDAISQTKKGMVQTFYEALGGRSRGEIVKRYGEDGAKLVDEISTAISRPPVVAGMINETIRLQGEAYKFTNTEILEIGEVIEGVRFPTNSRVMEGASFLRNIMDMFKVIRQHQNPKFKGLPNYMPHDAQIAKLTDPQIAGEIATGMVRRGDVKTIEDASLMIQDYVEAFNGKGRGDRTKKWLIDSGQAANVTEASAILHQYMDRSRAGNHFRFFEKREAFLPFYDPNPFRVIPDYVEGATQFLYNVERFGERNKKLWQLVDNIDKVSMDNETAATIVDMFLTPHKFDSKFERIGKFLRGVQVVEKMSLSAVPNAFQGITGNAMTSKLKDVFGARSAMGKDMAAVESWARQVGEHPIGSSLAFERPADFAKKFLNITGFSKTEYRNYLMSTWLGRHKALTFFEKLKADPTNKKARIELERLKINPDVALERGFLSTIQLGEASLHAWRESQGIPTILNQPQKWLWFDTSKESGRLAFQFKSVAYGQTRLIVERAFKDAAKGRPAALIKLLILFPIFGEMIQDIKHLITFGGSPAGYLLSRINSDKSDDTHIIANFTAAFGFGILNNLYYWNKFGLPLGANMAQIEELITGQWMKQIKNIPIFGNRIYKSAKEQGQGNVLIRSKPINIR